MILYGNWRSLAVYRVRVALALKAIPHEVVSIDMAGGEHHGERFKAINPQGVLPALDDGHGHVLFQSLAIIDYLDVVCHSRGGLVVSWALKLAPLPVDQVVFVGTPLMGTSLAAPNRLRDALDLLANVADAMSQLARGTALAFPPAMPLALGAAGLAKVLGRVLNLGAALPLAKLLGMPAFPIIPQLFVGMLAPLSDGLYPSGSPRCVPLPQYVKTVSERVLSLIHI